jgi:hypothetical protein
VVLRDVIADIEQGRNSYIVDAGGRPTRVSVVHDPDGVYLRTSPDSDPANNLNALPACETLPPIDPLPIRRNAATVSADERRRLRDAILQLNHRTYPVGVGPPDPVSVWFKQDEIHQATHVHSQASFLAWHRVLLNEFEAKIREIDSTLALHYWDWTTHPQRSPDGRGGTVNLLDSDFMGADGTIGSPYLENDFYRPSPPNRDFDESGKPRGGPRPPALPPRLVDRMLPTSGHGPTEVTLEERDELWPPRFEGRPATVEMMRIRSDSDLVRPALFDRPGIAFERFGAACISTTGLPIASSAAISEEAGPPILHTPPSRTRSSSCSTRTSTDSGPAGNSAPPASKHEPSRRGDWNQHGPMASS